MAEAQSLPISLVVKNTSRKTENVRLFNYAKLNDPVWKLSNKITVMSYTLGVSYPEICLNLVQAPRVIGCTRLHAVTLKKVEKIMEVCLNQRAISKDTHGIIVTTPMKYNDRRKQHQKEFAESNTVFYMDCLFTFEFQMPAATEIELHFYDVPK